MKTKDFHYYLPPELIAVKPPVNRLDSRLLVVERESGINHHRGFGDIVEYLRPGDCLVLNDTKVIPARLHGKRSDGAAVELLLLRRHDGDVWEALTKPGRKCRQGDSLSFADGRLTAKVVGLGDDGIRIVELVYQGDFDDLLAEIGEMPLPPYISEAELKTASAKAGEKCNPVNRVTASASAGGEKSGVLTDSVSHFDRYQTVYACHKGSVAAPTAGLHFTPELLSRIEAMKVRIAAITLHVGLGTFRPVRTENIDEHRLHSEIYHISPNAAATINETKANGGRVIAVGTTSCRTLEATARLSPRTEPFTLLPASGETDIFIKPGHVFQVVDVLLTNFHLPESTLIMLVSAFAGHERTMAVYTEAIRERYRFYSYGDAMLII
ncbi:MAG: tRNA preQ1(34) S-adenosylmethionine ribosyltransferase-isomerase QueA [Lachnospiraceae bacterium]|jgi:S-adenosylmethionine:tRNA ribosyltransferase-isomerase|nr:tRNA preQ1(34) S-adenosylmethionine ribosyltransferase-isomerase QueA [Lachnospiraceae bacterium]